MDNREPTTPIDKFATNLKFACEIGCGWAYRGLNRESHAIGNAGCPELWPKIKIRSEVLDVDGSCGLGPRPLAATAIG